ncbi:YciI family protein [Intrasporangium sp.]|jgi:hypothetical protein|uniref:YciI family protein n=1 Tax=Intrasporangium sp. TaxID=1925024 RepID=UPI00336566F6
MKTYLMSLYTPNVPPPEDLDLGPVMAEIERVNDEIRAANGWVFAGGLGDLASATTVSVGANGSPLLTDGPYAEVREHLGGLSIVRSDDYDRVLRWAERIASATGFPVEVRPFVTEDDPGQQPTTE